MISMNFNDFHERTHLNVIQLAGSEISYGYIIENKMIFINKDVMFEKANSRDLFKHLLKNVNFKKEVFIK